MPPRASTTAPAASQTLVALPRGRNAGVARAQSRNRSPAAAGKKKPCEPTSGATARATRRTPERDLVVRKGWPARAVRRRHGERVVEPAVDVLVPHAPLPVGEPLADDGGVALAVHRVAEVDVEAGESSAGRVGLEAADDEARRRRVEDDEIERRADVSRAVLQIQEVRLEDAARRVPRAKPRRGEVDARAVPRLERRERRGVDGSRHVRRDRRVGVDESGQVPQRRVHVREVLEERRAHQHRRGAGRARQRQRQRVNAADHLRGRAAATTRSAQPTARDAGTASTRELAPHKAALEFNDGVALQDAAS